MRGLRGAFLTSGVPALLLPFASVAAGESVLFLTASITISPALPQPSRPASLVRKVSASLAILLVC